MTSTLFKSKLFRFIYLRKLHKAPSPSKVSGSNFLKREHFQRVVIATNEYSFTKQPSKFIVKLISPVHELTINPHE